MRSFDIRPGVRIGILTAISKTSRTLTSGRHMPAWSMKCDCGTVLVAMTTNLVKGSHQSCGCARIERAAQRREEKTAARLNRPPRTNPEAVHRKPEYRIYRQMLDRCYLTTAPNYRYYGGKGVFVCERWRRGDAPMTGFECFFEDMGPRPDGLTLDRIDPFEPYQPDNCRWATWAEQAQNKREHRLSPFELAALRKHRGDARRGEKSVRAKLTDAMVMEIKKLIRAGARTGDLAEQFNVAPQTICGIKAGRNWTHVEAA